MRALITVVLAFVLATALTVLFLRWVAARQIVALENHRTMHAGAVPTGGGLPLLAAAGLVAVALWPVASGMWLLLGAGALLAAVSWADDVSGVTPALRLAIHLAAAALAVASLPGDALIFQGALPFVLDRLVAGLALAWFMNLYNFMDGIDGLAGVETVSLVAGYLAVTAAAGAEHPFEGLALALAGATAGFLVWNWAPARLFLGDVGSVPLGFFTGVLMLDLAVRASLAAALILPLYFFADATITLGARLLRGEKPWEPHRDHFYQRAARGLASHSAVSTRVLAANVLLAATAVLALWAPFVAVLIAVVIVAKLLYALDFAALA